MDANPHRDRFSLVVALLGSLVYAGVLSHYQWNHYLGWPSFAFSQGAVEFGWPNTYLTEHSTLVDDRQGTWKRWSEWSDRNLVLNSLFCGFLSCGVAVWCWSLGRLLYDVRKKRTFSLGGLLALMTAVAMTFPILRAIEYWHRLGDNRWSTDIFTFERPVALDRLVMFGVFSLAYMLAIAFLALLRHSVSSRRRSPVAHSVQFAGAMKH